MFIENQYSTNDNLAFASRKICNKHFNESCKINKTITLKIFKELRAFRTHKTHNGEILVKAEDPSVCIYKALFTEYFPFHLVFNEHIRISDSSV